MADKVESRGEAQLIENLVGSVLGSVVKAQGLAASQLVQMVEQIGFTVTDGKRTTRTFDFDFFRTEFDAASNKILRKKVSASVPLITLINLPSIAIEEATIEMDLQLVAHEETVVPGDQAGPLKLFVVPARKQLVRTAQQALAIDSAGTIKIQVKMRQEPALGLDKLQSLLESATAELVGTATDPTAALPA